jgi:carbamoyl-phosphate synthase L subunit-like protein
MKLVALIATTHRWFPTARLGMALTKAGWTVDAVCPGGHPLAVTASARAIYRYSGLAPLRSFKAAIKKSQPTIIIPGDDRAMLQLYSLYRDEAMKGESGKQVCELIERSLGSATSFAVIERRPEFERIAAEEGIRVPCTLRVADIRELRSVVAKLGLPVVLKADGTAGGEGVRVAHSMDEAVHAFRKLQAPPLFARAAKRALIDQDSTLIWPCVTRKKFRVSAQGFVPGREATTAVACYKGTVLACLHFKVVNKSSDTGPSTVLQFVDNAEMADSAEKMVRRLGLSGFVGFDFMIEDATGDAYLIEINGRSTQVGHLALGPGRNLPVAMLAAVSGEPEPAVPAVTNNDTIALFPFEWLQNPQSPYLLSAYHDVPWEEAEFIRACVGKRKQKDLDALRTPKNAFAAVRVNHN